MSNVFVFAFYGTIGYAIAITCDDAVDHCFTSIDIKSAITMFRTDVGQVYAKNRQLYSSRINGPLAQIDDIITADGWNLTRTLITANGTMPGPPIFMYQNQTITIIVHNHLVNESVTIHWHGIDQLEHPAMDGVAYVSQCPILPGQSFNYTFKPRFGGSYWYHSHLGIQRDMGLYGAFIVLRKREPPMNQHIIQIQEWNHQYNAIELLNIGPLPYPHSILINGRGHFQDILAPIETFNVRKGDQYLFRLIGVGSHSTLLFSIPGLKLNVSETDGVEVVPTVVDKIIIFPAERYNFEIDLNYAEERIYNITVSVLSSPNLTIGNDIGLGFLNVTKGDSSPSKVYHTDDNKLRILNCPFETYPKREDFTCIPVSYLNSTEYPNDDASSDEHIQKNNGTLLRFLNFGFPGGRSSINGRIYHSPTVAPLTQPSETNTDCDACGDEKTCKCSYSLSLPPGSEIIMVMMTVGQGATISHPVHMHGHTFEVLKMFFPEVTNDGTFVFTDDIKCSETLTNSQSQCNNATWKNDSWNDYKNIPGINLNNPLRKDTIVVPYGGYVIIRINAMNPGVWFLHCHIDKHMIEGMAVMLNESFEFQHKYVPEGLPKCNSHLKSNSGVVNDVADIETETTTQQQNQDNTPPSNIETETTTQQQNQDNTPPSNAGCSLPGNLKDTAWEYNYTRLLDNSEQSTTLNIATTTLQNSVINLNAYGTTIDDWTCINSLTISDTEAVVVFKSDTSYTSGPSGPSFRLYLCMKFTAVTPDLYYFYLLSDINTDVIPNERVFTSSNTADDASICSTFCQYTETPKIRTLRKPGSSDSLPISTPLCDCASSCSEGIGSKEETSSWRVWLGISSGCFVVICLCIVCIIKLIRQHRPPPPRQPNFELWGKKNQTVTSY